MAQIEKLPGVDAVEVDWSGRKMRVRGGDPDGVVASLKAQGYGATPADLPATGERWLNREETIELSQREAGVLAKRYAKPVADKHGLDAAWLETVLREEIFAWFKANHAAGEKPDLHRGFAEVLDRVARRLPPDKRDAILEDLKKRGD